MKEYYFEKLSVWQEARSFVKQVYLFTLDFPESEKFGLSSQIRRAAMSITANIAEGTSRFTEKEKARFINIAYGSGIEVLNFLILANDLNYLADDAYLKLRADLEKITNQLNSFYKKFDK